MYSATLLYIRINKYILQCKTHYVRDCGEYTVHYSSRNRRRTKPWPKPALGKAKPVPSTSHTRILLPSDPANQSPGSFKWILPKSFHSTGRTHSSGLPSYPHDPVYRSLLYNTNPLYNKRSFPPRNIKFPTNVMFLVTKYFPERCIFKRSVKTAGMIHTNKNCYNYV